MRRKYFVEMKYIRFLFGIQDLFADKIRYYGDMTNLRTLLLRYIVPLAVVIIFIFYRAFLTPDAIFVLLLAIFLSLGMGVEFLRRFLPFVALLITYDGLRGFVPFLSKHVHFTLMPNFDTKLFGTLPTLSLQRLLYHGHLQWYDFYFYGLYMLHFVVPLLVGVLLWLKRPKEYWTYVWSLIALSYMGFLTFLAFPAAPPWMASEMHIIPMIHKLSTDIWYAIGVHNFPTLYAQFNPNPVAAVPSLHSAYPTLITLIIGKVFGLRWGLVSAIYPLSIWFGVVYMGEHYVFDVIAGALYAIAAFLCVPYIMRWFNRRFRTKHAVRT